MRCSIEPKDRMYLAGKYWSPELPEDVFLQRPQDIPQRSYLTVPRTSRSDVTGTS